MAKIPFSKLVTTKDIPSNETVIQWKEYEIVIKTYLPINDKLDLISKVINQSVDAQMTYANPVKVDLYTTLEIVQAYTNISFTENQLSDPTKLYDKLYQSGLLSQIIEVIPEQERTSLYKSLHESIDAVYAYYNSVMGVLDTISTDYTNLNLDVENLQQKMTNKENLTLLKDVLSKLG